MSASSIPAASLVAALRKLRETERYWPAMAADPAQRAKLKETHARIEAELEAMQRVSKEATRTRDALAKVLRRVRPRILA
jgi:PP-loop superfamily ATP-utilizing enzyme